MQTQQSLIGLLSLFLLASTPVAASASEGDEVKNDATSDAHTAKREVKKAGHRISEATCTGSKAECAGRKTKHRLQEGADKVSDKVSEGDDRIKEDVK
jgi:hypothetical protein